MNRAQLELLLNQLYNASLAINEAVKKDDVEELGNLISNKSATLRLLEKNKKFLDDDAMTLFDIMLVKIQEQEQENINLLKEKRNQFYQKYRKQVRASKILNKYSSKIVQNGMIVDAVQ